MRPARLGISALWTGLPTTTYLPGDVVLAVVGWRVPYAIDGNSVAQLIATHAQIRQLALDPNFRIVFFSTTEPEEAIGPTKTFANATPSNICKAHTENWRPTSLQLIISTVLLGMRKISRSIVGLRLLVSCESRCLSHQVLDGSSKVVTFTAYLRFQGLQTGQIR